MRHLFHLARRFFASVVARRPGPTDQEFVARHLSGELARVFWLQPVPDLDHAVRGARHVASRLPARADAVRAFLLHDVGKRHARLGTIGRSLVTAARLVRLPTGRRGRAYVEHARVGAAELLDVGAGELEVAFARHHHRDEPPDGIDGHVWSVLVAADRR